MQPFIDLFTQLQANLLTIAPIVWLLASFVRRVGPLFGQVQQILGGLNTILQEDLSGTGGPSNRGRLWKGQQDAERGGFPRRSAELVPLPGSLVRFR